jgi:hypothetical protein
MPRVSGTRIIEANNVPEAQVRKPLASILVQPSFQQLTVP